jgi:hypothetical protein
MRSNYMFISNRRNKPSTGGISRSVKRKRYEHNEHQRMEALLNAVSFAILTPQKKNAA